MILTILVLFVIVNCTLSGTAATSIADLPPADTKRRGMLIVIGVLLANSAVFLTLYALYANGFFK